MNVYICTLREINNHHTPVKTILAIAENAETAFEFAEESLQDKNLQGWTVGKIHRAYHFDVTEQQRGYYFGTELETTEVFVE